jgi:hypothetical protein
VLSGSIVAKSTSRKSALFLRGKGERTAHIYDKCCYHSLTAATIATMTEWHELVSTIDSCHSLFLREIGEPEENILRIVLHEGRVNSESESQNVGGVIIENLHRVEPTSDSLVIELIWPQYIAYSVTNESFSKPEGSEAADSGRLLRRYSKSSLLDHIARSTIATKEYPGEFHHFQVVAEMHVVDVVSMGMPTFRVLNGR